MPNTQVREEVSDNVSPRPAQQDLSHVAIGDSVPLGILFCAQRAGADISDNLVGDLGVVVDLSYLNQLALRSTAERLIAPVGLVGSVVQVARAYTGSDVTGVARDHRHDPCDEVERHALCIDGVTSLHAWQQNLKSPVPLSGMNMGYPKPTRIIVVNDGDFRPEPGLQGRRVTPGPQLDLIHEQGV